MTRNKTTRKPYAPAYGTPLEHAILRALIEELRAVGWPVVSVNDGCEEQNVPARSVRAALDAVFAVDDCTICFRKKGGPTFGVFVVCGNDAEFISDHHTSKKHPEFAEAIDRVQDRIEAGHIVIL